MYCTGARVHRPRDDESNQQLHSAESATFLCTTRVRVATALAPVFEGAKVRKERSRGRTDRQANVEMKHRREIARNEGKHEVVISCGL